MKSNKRKGFTLVELLIVIVVIGILSAMMMLSSTEAVTSAKANNILSDLRNLKTATLAWYTDHIDSVDHAEGKIKGTGKYVQAANLGTDIMKYLNGDALKFFSGSDFKGTNAEGKYGVWNVGDDRTTWYVGYCFKTTEGDLKPKLKARASSTGLHFGGEWPEKAGDTVVWMKIFGDWNPPK